MNDTTTRQERVGWSAEQAIARIIQSGGTERGTVALAMSEQLAAAGVPPDALEMCIVMWSRSLDGLPVGPVPAERLTRLDQDLSFEMQSSPVLGRWLGALRAPIRQASDLDFVIQFLMQVRQTWMMTGALAARR